MTHRLAEASPHGERFAALTRLLAEWQPLWRPAPFMHPALPWAERFAELHRTLLTLPEAECVRLQDAPWENSPLAPWLPVAALAAATRLPALAGEAALPESWGEHMGEHVGERKWRQIAAFAPRVTPRAGEALVEWCAGKGHLARTLARRHGVEVTALEWRPELCEEGSRLAEAQGARVRWAVQDVLAPDAGRWLDASSQVVALHACGDLHVRLLALAAERGCAIALAPCCYQRTAAAHYRPLSRRGGALAEAHGLSLTREELALAVQETVTAPQGVRRHRERASAWRLGFDLLQRELRGIDDYLPVPSLAYGRMPARFADFCRWAARRKGLALPPNVDWDAVEREGWRRQAEVARLELVRHLFRRPLEVWLALDRFHYLEEAGFAVELGTFCERQLTPRNLLLRGVPPRS